MPPKSTVPPLFGPDTLPDGRTIDLVRSGGGLYINVRKGKERDRRRPKKDSNVHDIAQLLGVAVEHVPPLLLEALLSAGATNESTYFAVLHTRLSTRSHVDQLALC